MSYSFVQKAFAGLALLMSFPLSPGNALAEGAHFQVPNFIGIRPAGMGQAFTAVADDQHALYYNPAGLARMDTWSFEVFNFIGGVNAELLQNINDALDAMGDSTTSQKPENLVRSFRDRFGEENSFRFGLNPYFVKKNFGFALLANQALNVTLHNGAPDIVSLESASDAEARFGGGYRFMGDKLALGAAVSVRQRYFIGESLGYEKLSTLLKQSDKTQENLRSMVQAGLGVGADFGVMFTPIETWTPTLGLSILNLGDVNFFKNDSSAARAPDPIPQSVNVGIAVTPTWGRYFLRGSLDFRDLNLPTAASKKPSIGFETGFGTLARAQLGLSEGYLTGGFEFRLFVLNLRYATYATSRGYFPRQDVQRMHLVGAKILL